MIMGKYKPKNYRCVNCGREQYTKEHCFECKGNTFEKLHEKAEERELRQLLHNTIDVMSYEQCKKIAELLNFSNEFGE